jgi:hypothetical protein
MAFSEDIRDLLTTNAWLRRRRPFTHYVAFPAFVESFRDALAINLADLRSLGLSPTPSTNRLGRNMPHSDGYSWDFPPDIDGPLSVFYSRAWHRLLAGLARRSLTTDVNAAVHHHPLGAPAGFVHQDTGIAHFSDQPRADGINPMDLSRCAYFRGTAAPGLPIRRVRRALTMIYFIGPNSVQHGRGATGLYSRPDQPADAPALAVAPADNSLLIFENTPDSHHAFMGGPAVPRTSVILWLHHADPGR